MAITERDEHQYGESQADLREVIARYSEATGYPATDFADAACSCGSRLFHLVLDDTAGAAFRICTKCEAEHPIGDSAEHLEDAELEDVECLCGADAFEITAAVSPYPDSDTVRWFYLACRCPTCGLAGVYGDWKNEFEGTRELLSRV